MGDEVVLREYRAADLPFVYSSWIRSDARSPLSLSLDPKIRCETTHDRIEALWKVPNTVCLVLHPEGMEDEIVGWVCLTDAHPPVIHYLYVKEVYRGRGFGTKLMDAASDGWRKEVWCTSLPAYRWFKHWAKRLRIRRTI